MKKNRAEFLQDALGGIDARFVDEAVNVVPSAERPEGRRTAWVAIFAATVAAMIVCAVTFLPGSLFDRFTEQSRDPHHGVIPGVPPGMNIFEGYAEVIETFREVVETVDSRGERRVEFDNADEEKIYADIYRAVEGNLLDFLLDREDSTRLFTKFFCNYSFEDLNGDGQAELIFFTDSGTVLALFTSDGQRCISLGGYIYSQLCHVTDKGYVTVWGNVGGDGMTVYSIAADGSGLEEIERILCVGEGLGVTRHFYRESNGKKEELTYDEYQAAIAGYPSAELKGEPLFGERGRAMRKLFEALDNSINVHEVQFGEYVKLFFCRDGHSGQYIGYSTLSHHNINIQCAAVDLDGDGIEEIILDTEGRGVLRYYDGEVYYYADELSDVYTDGSLFFRGRAEYVYGVMRMGFNGAEKVTRTVWSVTDKGTERVKYRIGDEVVTKEVYDAFVSTCCTEKVRYYSLATQRGGWFIEVDPELAMIIAEMYWVVKNGDLDYETRGRYKITIAEWSLSEECEEYTIEMKIVAEDGTVLRTYAPLSINKKTGVISKG